MKIRSVAVHDGVLSVEVFSEKKLELKRRAQQPAEDDDDDDDDVIHLSDDDVPDNEADPDSDLEIIEPGVAVDVEEDAGSAHSDALSFAASSESGAEAAQEEAVEDQGPIMPNNF